MSVRGTLWFHVLLNSSAGRCGLICKTFPFNGPITVQVTCKMTQRQRISASDWPVEPSRRRKKPNYPPYLQQNSRGKIILNPQSKYQFLRDHTSIHSVQICQRWQVVTLSTRTQGNQTLVQQEKNKDRKQEQSVDRVPLSQDNNNRQWKEYTFR